MFVDILEKYVAPGREQDVLDTAKESMDLHRAYFGPWPQCDVSNLVMAKEKPVNCRAGQRVEKNQLLRFLENACSVAFV